MAARQGRISFFGGLPKTDTFIKADSNLIHYRQLHVHGANGSSPAHNKRALEYISTGQVPVKDLITRHVALADVMDVFDIVARGEAIRAPSSPSPQALAADGMPACGVPGSSGRRRTGSSAAAYGLEREGTGSRGRTRTSPAPLATRAG